MGIEKRGRERKVFNARIKGHTQPLHVFDVSPDGVRLVGDFKPTADEIEVELDFGGNVTEHQGRVVWCKSYGPSGVYQVGVQFTGDALPPEVQGSPAELDSEARGALLNLSKAELEHLRLLTRISGIFNESSDVEELLRRAMDVTMQILDAERGLLLTGDGENWTPLVTHGEERSGFSTMVTGHVVRTGKALISVDVAEDSRLTTSSSLQILGTRSVLCVPIKIEDRFLGLIYLDNSMATGAFRDPELHLVTVIADMAASALERAEYLSVLTESRQQLAEALEDLHSLVEMNPDGMVVIDDDQRVCFSNPAARELLGAEIQGLPLPFSVEAGEVQLESGPVEVRRKPTNWAGQSAQLMILRPV